MITNEDLKDQAVADTLDWLTAEFNLDIQQACHILKQFKICYPDAKYSDLGEKYLYLGYFPNKRDLVKQEHESYFECLKNNPSPFNDPDLVIDWDYVEECFNLNNCDILCSNDHYFKTN